MEVKSRPVSDQRVAGTAAPGNHVGARCSSPMLLRCAWGDAVRAMRGNVRTENCSGGRCCLQPVVALEFPGSFTLSHGLKSWRLLTTKCGAQSLTHVAE